MIFQTTTLSPTRLVSISATKAAIGGTTATLTTPNFSGLAGWSDQWMAGPAATGTWGIYATGTTFPQGGVCQEGGRLFTATRLGVF